MLAALLAAEPVEARIDHIALVVGERVVLGSDLAVEERLAQMDPIPIPALQRRRAASREEWLIDAAVIRGLAGSTSVYTPSPADVALRVERVRAQMPDEGAWFVFLATAGLTADTFASLIYTRLVVERYVQRNAGVLALGDGPEADEAYAAWVSGLRARVAIRRPALP